MNFFLSCFGVLSLFLLSGLALVGDPCRVALTGAGLVPGGLDPPVW